MENKISISWTMLENGLNSLNSAANNLFILEEEKYSDYESVKNIIKDVILSLSSGVELVLKHRLYIENWSFIFLKIDDADKLKIISGDFKSVDLETSLKRLEKLCNIKVSNQSLLTKLRESRNKLEHYRLTIDFDEFYMLTIKVLTFIMDFIVLYIEVQNEEEMFEFENLKTMLPKLSKYIALREEIIQNQYPDETFYFCPYCGKRYLILDGNVECKLCHYKNSPEEAANSYIEDIMQISSFVCAQGGDELPLYECPHCNCESFVYDDIISKTGFCYSCGSENPISNYFFCTECGQIYEYISDGISICNNCIDYKMINDD